MFCLPQSLILRKKGQFSGVGRRVTAHTHTQLNSHKHLILARFSKIQHDISSKNPFFSFFSLCCRVHCIACVIWPSLMSSASSWASVGLFHRFACDVLSSLALRPLCFFAFGRAILQWPLFLLPLLWVYQMRSDPRSAALARAARSKRCRRRRKSVQPKGAIFTGRYVSNRYKNRSP